MRPSNGLLWLRLFIGFFLLTQGLNVTEGNDRFIRVDGIELGFDECYELNFFTRVIDVPLSTIGTEVRVDSIENEVVVEYIAVEGILLNPQALNPVDFENVSGFSRAGFT
ncbi:MAG: hypothetical protein H6557_30970 [Lewinellaceae bacterium]|nr:hypothetical protein [Phaeodactylibacter sp.]MCB9041073.1 hypothetical protein [Lewinellaceae bacterium]